MAKKNYKQPILQWLATGNNARRTVENALIAFRKDVPELKKCPDQTIIDYYHRYAAGMRATDKPVADRNARLFIQAPKKTT